MNLLEISQVIFNLIASLTMVVIMVIVSIVAFEVIKVLSQIARAAQYLKFTAERVSGRVDSLVASISSLAFITPFFKRKRSSRTEDSAEPPLSRPGKNKS